MIVVYLCLKLNPVLMKVIRSFLILIIVCSTSQLSAQWELGVKNLLRFDNSNVQLYLKYEAASSSNKSFYADIIFWTGEENSRKVFLRKESKIQTNRSQVFNFGFQIPEGTYRVDVDIYDKELEKYVHLTLDEKVQVNASNREALLSDIYLSYESDPPIAFRNPVLNQLLEVGTEELYYFLEVYTLNSRRLTTRATLYKESGNQAYRSTSAYTSLNQTSRQILTSPEQKGQFGDTLDLRGLQPGEYMIQVLIYDEDYLLSEENAWFVLGGDIKQRVLENLEESIRMLTYILPDSIVDQLLQEPIGDVKEVAFLNSWKRLYHKDTEAKMEAYYAKMFEANRRFQDEEENGIVLPGWQTERGRIFVQYGEPTEKQIQIRGKPYLVWTYAKWSLSFLFEQQEQRYVLVET